MNYDTINTEGKIAGITQRIAQLEAQHYTDEIYLFEANIVLNSGLTKDDSEVSQLELQLHAIELRIAGLKELIEQLKEAQDDTEKQDESGQ